MPQIITNDPIAGTSYNRVTCAANDASGATSGRATINLRKGFREITLYASAAARVGFPPRIAAVFFYDASADTWEDLLGDNQAILDSAQTGAARFTLAAADYLYIATIGRTGGFRFTTPTTVNNNAATMAFQYSTLNGFVTSAVTDGTDSGGATLAVTANPANITIDTVPADGVWTPQTLQALLGLTPVTAGRLRNANAKFYWSRLQPSALLDVVVATQLSALIPNPQAANAANAAGGSQYLQATTIHAMDINDDRIGALEYRGDATTGTPTIDINWYER